MSFGFGIGDFIDIIELATKIRKDFSSAPEHYQGIASDVKHLSIILQDVDTFIAGNDLSQAQEEGLREIGAGCQQVLQKINKALDKYSSLGTNTDTKDRSFKKRVRRAWQQVKLEPAEFREYRNAITLNVSLLNTFMNGVVRDGVATLLENQENQENQAILEWLAPAAYRAQQTSNIRQRLEGTGQWLLESSEFKRWVSSSREVLFLHGIAGAGKTILSSIIIEHLYKIHENEKSGLLYFYCDYSQQDTQNMDAIMLAWLRQVTEISQTFPKQVIELYKLCQKDHRRPKPEEVETTLKTISRSFTKLHIVVDALDECQISVQQQFVQKLLHLSQTIGARVVATSRPIPHIQAMFDGSLSMEIRATADDIRNYVDRNMADLPDFVVSSPELQEEVKVKLVESADSLFLLVKLNFETLKDVITVKKFRTALSEFAQHKGDYAEAYGKTMALINSQSPSKKELALKVLAWIVMARRPLTIRELSHALAIEPGSRILDEDNIPTDSSIISLCHGLVIVETETDIVHLVHFTTQEFFKGPGLQWLEPFEIELSNTCLLYLSLSNFDAGPCSSRRELSLRFSSWVFYKYASLYWGLHARNQVDLDLARCFLENEKHMASSSQVFYAGQSRTIRSPLSIIVESLWTPAHFIAYFGLHDWLDRFSELCNIDSIDCRQKTPLMIAAGENQIEAVHLLVEKGAQLDICDENGWTPLVHAATHGHEAIVRFLVENGAQLHVASQQHDNTALISAAKCGHEAIVRFLVEKGAQPDIPSTPDGLTALTYASLRGHEAIVRFLVEKGAQLDTASKSIGYTALMHASRNGHEGIVRFLVEKGAQLAITDNFGNTVLSTAAKGGNEAVVRFLVEKGAQLDVAGEFGYTALIWACHQGHEGVARVLVEKGAQLDITADHGLTALMYASRGGYENIVRCLVEKGARLDIVGYERRSALSFASTEDIARLLRGETPGSNPDLAGERVKQEQDQRWSRPLPALSNEGW